MEDQSCRGYSFSREVNLLLKSENYALKIFNLFSIFEWQGGYVILKITIYPSNMRGVHIYTSGYIFQSGYFMTMGVDNLVGLRCQVVFYTGLICQVHKKGVAKVIVGICIPRLWRKRTIWDKGLLKLRVSFDVMVIRKKVLSESSYCICTHILCGCRSSWCP